MAVYRSVKAYQKSWAKRAREMLNVKERSSVNSASFMMAKARSLAPRLTGETVSGIKKRKGKEGAWIVESRVRAKGKSGFRQNMWANHTAPHDRPRMRWNRGQPTFYGDGSHRTTSKAPNIGFYNRAALDTRNHFKTGVLANTRKALRVNL